MYRQRVNSLNPKDGAKLLVQIFLSTYQQLRIWLFQDLTRMRLTLVVSAMRLWLSNWIQYEGNNEHTRFWRGKPFDKGKNPRAAKPGDECTINWVFREFFKKEWKRDLPFRGFPCSSCHLWRWRTRVESLSRSRIVSPQPSATWACCTAGSFH